MRRRPLEPRASGGADDTAGVAGAGDAAPPDPEDTLLRRETRRLVLEALADLPPERRLVIELKVYQERTFDEIAEILDTPPSTIKTQFYSGLSALRRRLAAGAARPTAMGEDDAP